MIVTMAKVRILGPRDRLDEALRALQDVGVLHLTPVAERDRIVAVGRDARAVRRAKALGRALDDVEAALAVLGDPERPPPPGPPPGDLPGWRRHARRVRRAVDRLERERLALSEERALLEKYRGYFRRFETLLHDAARWPNARAYHLMLRSGDERVMTGLRAALAAAIGDAFELRAEALEGGETALLLIVTSDVSPRIERVLAKAGVQELPVPPAYAAGSLTDSLPRMRERLEAIPAELDSLARELGELGRRERTWLARVRGEIRDRIALDEAFSLSAVSTRVFVIEGWLPESLRPRLDERLSSGLGALVIVEDLVEEPWAAAEAPVVLSNPRLFRPFEAVVSLLPLPRYGNIDPTPFVAVFFPMFFGLILGDVGYGLVLAALALWLHHRSRPGTRFRDVAEITGPCAAFTIVFGFAYGELFGDFGRHQLGMKPFLFDREESVIAFLLLAVAIGVVHVVLGLVLGVVTSFREHPRKAAGRGLAAVMVLVVVLALLAAVEVLPAAFFTPSVVFLLAAFPVLVFLEGVVAPIEFLSMLGNILSYARIMAIGTASVMLAVVANEMAGATGSVIVGATFALLFHLVNFALGIFSPTIHALRLHYVEFFGKFYSPGGVRYRPFGHWTPATG